MRIAGSIALAGCLMAAPAFAQKWEFGGGAGWGFYTSQTIKGARGSADATFEPGVAWSAYLSNQVNERWGGELRYTFQLGDARLESGGQKATFGAQSHAISYEFQWHAQPTEAKARFFLAGGGGVKSYRGTGRELPTQALSNIGLLTRSNDIRGLVTVAAGVKVRLSDHWNLRVEVRDNMTLFPKSVLAPSVGATVNGWIHDIMPMVTVGYAW